MFNITKSCVLVRISGEQCHHILVHGRSHRSRWQPGDSNIMPLQTRWLCFVYTLGTERKKKQQRAEEDEVKKSTPLPYLYHKDISINLESTLYPLPETNRRDVSPCGAILSARVSCTPPNLSRHKMKNLVSNCNHSWTFL